MCVCLCVFVCVCVYNYSYYTKSIDLEVYFFTHPCIT